MQAFHTILIEVDDVRSFTGNQVKHNCGTYKEEVNEKREPKESVKSRLSICICMSVCAFVHVTSGMNHQIPYAHITPLLVV